MNRWQAAKQLQYLLRAQEWTDSSTKVFARNSVVVTLGLPVDVAAQLVMPLALIRPGGGETDPDKGQEPDYIRQTMGVTLLTAIPSDALGEGVVLGANMQSLTDSRGRGLLELEEELHNAIGRLSQVNGIAVYGKASSAADVTFVEGTGYIAFVDWRFELGLSVARTYPPVVRFAATPGAGQVAMAWQLPPDRFDRLEMVLRRASGSTPPPTASDGTSVALSGALATSKTDTGLAAGTYSYSLFAGYDEHGKGTVERYASAATKTVVVS